MVDLSPIMSFVQIKEIQVFFGVIIIGILVYILLVMLKPVFEWIISFFSKSPRYEEPVKDRLKAFDEDLKSNKTAAKKALKKGKGYDIFYDEVKVKEKALFSISIDAFLLERIIFISIIVIELILVLWGALA